MREELFHPLFAHFPIVLLSMSPLIYALRFFPKVEQPFAIVGFRFFIYGGLFSLGISLLLGEVAINSLESQVNSLQLFYDHEDFAYYSLYCFTLGAILDHISSLKWKVGLQAICLVSLLTGLVFLIRTAHFGAQLVYDHGVAVKILLP